MFRITIEEVAQGPFEIGANVPPAEKIYEQSVEVLDLHRVIDAINYKPRVYTKRAKKGGEQA